LLLAAVIGSALLAAGAQRRRWLPDWHGPVAWLADLVLAWTIILGTAQALGAVGLFRAAPLVAATVIVSAGLTATGQRRGRADVVTPPGDDRDRSSAPVRWALLATVAVVAGEWASYTAQSLRVGITAADSLWYHLPRAARFVQTGWLTHLHQTAPEFPDAFHPSSGEVVQALPMLMYQRDAVSPIINLGWMAMLLLAAWCVGRPSGRAELATLGVAALLASPLVVAEGAGNAGNDIAAMAFLLASLAFLLQPGGTIAQAGLAGLAAGLAISTKLTVVPPVAVLTLGVLWAARPGERARRALAWSAGLGLTGAYWYVRNLVAVGSPVPSTDLPFLGHRSFRIADELGFSVADYLTDRQVWRSWFLPGLRADFGWAWPVLVAVVIWATIAALREPRDRLIRTLGVLVPVSVVAYLTLPTTALGERGQPILFAGNVIYVVPVLAVALAVLPILPGRDSVAARRLLLAGCAAVVIGGALTSPLSTIADGNAPAAAGVAVLVGAVGLWWSRAGRPPLHRTGLVALVAGVAVVGVVSGQVVADRYLVGRYRDVPVYQWAASVSGARIAIAGFAGQFPLYGPQLDNTVTYLGHQRSNGEFHDLRSCSAWRTALREGRYDYVVLRSERTDVTRRQLVWTSSDPAASPAVDDAGYHVFRFDPSVPDPGCP
jgi:hypothetical protein